MVRASYLLRPPQPGRPATRGRASTSINGPKLLKDPRVTAAIRSEVQRRIRTLGPEAVQSLTEIAGDPVHKDRLKAVNVILERIDPVATKIDVSHTHVINHTKTALEHLERLRDSLKSVGMSSFPSLARLDLRGWKDFWPKRPSQSLTRNSQKLMVGRAGKMVEDDEPQSISRPF